MSYRMIHTIRRLMCDKFSILCTLAELNEREERRMKLGVKVKRLNDEAVIPKYAHDGDAGVDLVSAEDIIVEPGDTKLVSTGLAFSIPPGFEMQVRPRSGITLRTKLRVQLGTVDSGYVGEVKVIVDNTHNGYMGGTVKRYAMDLNGKPIRETAGNAIYGSYLIRKGDRICQAVFSPVEAAHFYPVDDLDDSTRGSGGFGSSGVR
jgi:dUTP pyrophosphatase